jgi:hypothetical protein
VAHTHEYLVPEEYHHLRPQCRGGQTVPANMVWLCANAHSDVHYFLDLIEKRAKGHARHPEAVPGAVAVHYGPKVRHYARLGWSLYADQFLAGEFDAHALMWDTSGRPTDDAAQSGVPPYAVAEAASEASYWLRLGRQRLARTTGSAGPGFEWAAK